MRGSCGLAVAVAWTMLAYSSAAADSPSEAAAQSGPASLTVAPGPLMPTAPASSAKPGDGRLILRAWGVPDAAAIDVMALSRLKIVEAFRRKYPNVEPVPTTGIELPGGLTMDFVPLMQIAGDIPAHVMYVNFRQSDTFISNKLLYPLDKYLENHLEANIADSHLLDVEPYVERLRQCPKYATELEERIPRQCWQVIRRECPYGADCPYVKAWGGKPAARHYHVWAIPQGPCVMALFYRKDLFRQAGLPDRLPDTMEEFLQFARKLTNPKEDRYGVELSVTGLSWQTMGFLYSMGGRMVDKDANGQWRCMFDSEAAVEAYYYVARLVMEPFDNQYGHWDTVIYSGQTRGGGEAKIGMVFDYLDQRFFASQRDPGQYGFGPVPRGPTGFRGSEFNSMMTGIYAGIEDQLALRDAAWDYILFFDGPEARRISAQTYVANGLGRYVRPELLRMAGFPEYLKQIPATWEEAYQQAMDKGVPEPYGKNCQMVYKYVDQAINQINTDPVVKEAIQEKHDPEAAKNRIREILRERVQRSNEKMLSILTPEQRKFRTNVATVVAVAIVVIFALVFRKVFKTFSAASMGLMPEGPSKRKRRYTWAYILLAPAVASIALWAYYPLARGTVIAFQDYNVRGFSKFLGLENFANCLFDDEFWFSMWVSVKYTVMFAVFGFTTPIILAFLLSEVPKGKVVFRVIYFLPAVLSGVIVIFLWQGFYGEYGAVNSILNLFIRGINGAFYYNIPLMHGPIAEVHTIWLNDPKFALFFVLLPEIWAGVGPGCLIYLAALKTIPDEIYESADIDGAGIFSKVFNVALPNIRSLVLINFIGAMVGAIRGSSDFVLAMTGGGPYAPYGSTEVIGLHIYWQAYGYLRFGQASAMAWVLGSMLVGFTVLRLQQLSRLEFRAAAGVA